VTAELARSAEEGAHSVPKKQLRDRRKFDIVKHRFDGKGPPFSQTVEVVQGLAQAERTVERLNKTLTDDEKASGLSHFHQRSGRRLRD
jgi:hypothetical protein